LLFFYFPRDQHDADTSIEQMLSNAALMLQAGKTILDLGACLKPHTFDGQSYQQGGGQVELCLISHASLILIEDPGFCIVVYGAGAYQVR